MAGDKKHSGLQPRPGVMDIVAYKGGETKDESFAGKLSSNESALGTSPKAVAAYQEAAKNLHRYPDGASWKLRKALAEHYQLTMDRLVCGFGSDELLTLACLGFADNGDEVLFGEHGFLVYPIAARVAGATPVAAPENGYTVDVDALLDRVTERTKLVFIANPNNPTGTYIPDSEIRRLHAGLPDHVLLVLDGAYAEYVDAADYDSGLALAQKVDNVLVTRTFSKIYGLAGLRLGWAYGPDVVIDVIDRLRGPFNVSGPAQAAGLAALADQDFIKRQQQHNSQWRDWLVQQLNGMGLQTVPSVTNFILVKFASAEQAMAADAFTRDAGYYLRGMAGYGFPDCLRLTIGTEEENRAVTDALRAFMGAR